MSVGHIARSLALLPRRLRSQPVGRDFRPDIQGLRAVAVLLVALNHAGVPHLGGGYVGVDVFFVISGFLITGWLVKRTRQEGRVPFAAFYAARARRILPAATLTLVVTAIASHYLLNYVRALSVLHDIVWAAFFAANIHFAQVGADYFARNNPPSPVQNFWTLAVEEQFYIIWPVLLAAGILLFGDRSSVRRRYSRRLDDHGLERLSLLVVLLVSGSLVWSIRETPLDPTNAYFSTLTRAWELGFGALIALQLPRLKRLPAKVRAPMTWIGLAGILLAGLAFRAKHRFPVMPLSYLSWARDSSSSAGSAMRPAAALGSS